jgi:hypothetical protein
MKTRSDDSYRPIAGRKFAGSALLRKASLVAGLLMLTPMTMGALAARHGPVAETLSFSPSPPVKTMNETQFLLRIGYPIQFCRSEAEAVAHLERLIVGGQCGLDEGVPFYLSHLSRLVDLESSVFPEAPLENFPFDRKQLKTLLSALRDVLAQRSLQ